jgi:hypothetical protein
MSLSTFRFLLLQLAVLYCRRGNAQELAVTNFRFSNDAVFMESAYDSTSVLTSRRRLSLSAAAKQPVYKNTEETLIYHLTTGAAVKISTYFDSTFLYEETDQQGRLVATGFVCPDRHRYEIDTLTIIDPFTDDRRVRYDTAFLIQQTGSWQERISGSRFAVGNYKDGLKNSTWYVVDTVLGPDVVFAQTIFEKGTVRSHRDFDLAKDPSAVRRLLKGKWYLYQQRGAAVIEARTQQSLSYPFQYAGMLEFISDTSLRFFKYYSCSTGVDLKKEQAVQKWTLTPDKHIVFGRYNFKLLFLSAEKILLSEQELAR